MKTLIVVPARYGSTRMPGKPLVEIAGVPMVQRVFAKAQAAAQQLTDVQCVVATDDIRIEDFCKSAGMPVVMTDPDLPSGSDRALAAHAGLGSDAEFILNLQGDAPFTPASYLVALVEEARRVPDAHVVTPVVPMGWDSLDALRASKQTKAQAFSGTTCVASQDGKAFWFSKNILPAIRKEESMRQSQDVSPVLKHVGLYGYRLSALKDFVAAGEGYYEALEGLEQLRALEMGMHIQVVKVAPAELAMSGIDTPEDLADAEALIAKMGDDYQALGVGS